MHDDIMHGEDSGAVAVIGVACRFPGAKNVEAFWENLRNGVESIKRFSEADIRELPKAILENPNYVGAAGALDDVDKFDAGFFGLTPNEAKATDPQQRFFLECAVEALERSGYNPDTHGEAVGVFAGADTSGYAERVRANSALYASIGEMQVAIGNEKDHLAPRFSYLLNLRGPSVPVQTTCSTSLVAVHMAYQSLVQHECDMALAGGVSVSPVNEGYVFEEGGIFSPDGHCRAYDADANGTIPGNGVGVVVLKRLAEALADGDTIHAVIRGSAVNNDGSAKVGYTAPSVEGQRLVIQEALAVAGIESAAISYVEGHGTGTNLGDPIEVEALRQAFQQSAKGSCALGSVKTNIGHCNSAAGIAGFIKTLLCLKNKTLVPSLNFEKPNPDLKLEDSPFYVNTETKSWDAPNRFAGVSSFGIGGTNAHIVLQSADDARLSPKGGPTARDTHVFTLSARNQAALDAKKLMLKMYLAYHVSAPLADVAHTLNVGRKHFEFRTCFSAKTHTEALQGLDGKTTVTSLLHRDGERDVVFLFPGQGADYQTFGKALYESEPVFRQEADHCAAILKPLLGDDLAKMVYGPDADLDSLKRPKFWQPLLFVTEYALAKLWLSLGVKPTAMMGHSIGEYVAATLSGVISLENGLQLLAKRALGTEEIDNGAMLAIPKPVEDVRGLLGDQLSLAAVNGPSLCVVSGPKDAVEKLAADMKAAGQSTIPLGASHAFHSTMMEPLMQPLADLAATFELKAPSIPYISNVTGTWMTEKDARDPQYWARHLREPVQFNAGLATLFKDSNRVYLEVGPGKVLSNLAKRHPDYNAGAVTSLDLAGQADDLAFAEAFGRLWCEGVSVDWHLFEGEGRRVRLELPPYPFQRETFWLESAPDMMSAQRTPGTFEGGKSPLNDWLFMPVWHQVPLSPHRRVAELDKESPWLVFLNGGEAGEALADHLAGLGLDVIRAYAGKIYESRNDGNFTIKTNDLESYRELIGRLEYKERLPSVVVHAMCLEDGPGPDEVVWADRLRNGFEAITLFLQAVAGENLQNKFHLSILTDGMQHVAGDMAQCPDKAILLGLVRTIPKELANFTCKSVDVKGPDLKRPGAMDRLAVELAVHGNDELVAFRNNCRWVQDVASIRWSGAEVKPPYREGGVYVITNALQEMGFALADLLVRDYKAVVLLVDRSFFPHPPEWAAWIADQGEDDYVSRKIARVRAIAEAGTDSRVITVDPGDPNRLAEAMDEVVRRHGQIHGVFSLPATFEAGLLQMKPIAALTRTLTMRAKETTALASVFKDLDFLAVFTRNLGEYGPGQVEEAAVYAYATHMAPYLEQKTGSRVLAVNWGTYGWENRYEEPPPMPAALREQLDEKRKLMGMSTDEFLTMLARGFDLPAGELSVSTMDYRMVIKQQRIMTAAFMQAQMESAGGDSHARPELSSDFVAPTNEVEALVAEAWSHFFGIEEIGIHDNFFEMGGHSLLAVQLLSKVNETFSTKITLTDLFDAPTIAEIAALIAGDEVEVEDAEDIDGLLAEIEGLSPEEIQALIDAES